MNVGRTVLESLIGLVVAVAAFMGGLFLCSRIPGTGGKWLSGLGEVMMGAVLFACCASAGLAFRFRAVSLLVTAGLILGLLIAIGELDGNWHYTALPVALSAAVVLTVGLIKQYARARKCYTGLEPTADGALSSASRSTPRVGGGSAFGR